MGSQTSNFRGLWGSEKEVFEKSYPNMSFDYYGHSGTTSEYRLEKEYYPFLDETKESIEKVIKSTETIQTMIHSGSINKKITKTVVKVMEKIPLAAETYSKYIKRELLSQAENLVEDTLKIAKLQRFLR